MPRHCSICAHPDRAAIDRDLVSGGSAPKIAANYRVSDDAVTRHRRHLTLTLPQARAVQADEVANIRHALDVVAQLKAINAASRAVLTEARAEGDGELVLKAVDRIQKQIELQARLLGDLDETPQINVMLMPEWLALRAQVLEALAAHPEARADVAARLMALEGINGHARG